MIFVPKPNTRWRTGFSARGDRNTKSPDCRDKSGTIFYKPWTNFSKSPSCEGDVSPCLRHLRVVKTQKRRPAAADLLLFCIKGNAFFLHRQMGVSGFNIWPGSLRHLSSVLLSAIQKPIFIAQCFSMCEVFTGFVS